MGIVISAVLAGVLLAQGFALWRSKHHALSIIAFVFSVLNAAVVAALALE